VNGLFKSARREWPFTGMLIDSELKFNFTIQFQGMPLEIAMTGKVEPDTMAGKASFGGMVDGDWTAKRTTDTAALPTPSTTPAAAPSAATASPAASSIPRPAAPRYVTLLPPRPHLPPPATLTAPPAQASATPRTQLRELPPDRTP